MATPTAADDSFWARSQSPGRFLTCELLYGGEKPFGGENVAKPQVLKSESLLACDIVFVSMQLYPDSAVPLMFTT